MFNDVKGQKNQKQENYEDFANSQYASQDLDQSQMEGQDNEDFDSHVMELLNSYNKYESPLSFVEMLEQEKKDILEKMDSHSAQLLFSYILEDYLQRHFPELDQNQDSFIQNMLMDYTIFEIIGIIKKGETEMLLNINVFLSSLGLDEIQRESQQTEE